MTHDSIRPPYPVYIICLFTREQLVLGTYRRQRDYKEIYTEDIKTTTDGHSRYSLFEWHTFAAYAATRQGLWPSSLNIYSGLLIWY